MAENTIPLENTSAEACKRAIDAIVRRFASKRNKNQNAPEINFALADGARLDMMQFFALVETHGTEMLPSLEKLLRKYTPSEIANGVMTAGIRWVPAVEAAIALDPSLRTLKKFALRFVEPRRMLDQILPLMAAKGWSEAMIVFAVANLCCFESNAIPRVWRDLGLADAVAARYTPPEFAAEVVKLYNVRASLAEQYEFPRYSLERIMKVLESTLGAETFQMIWDDEITSVRRVAEAMAPWTDWERAAFERLRLKEPAPVTAHSL
ncbi:MAG: hypothetical protein ACKVP7_02655 [Hyphomicrobiaceae bacterium]